VREIGLKNLFSAKSVPGKPLCGRKRIAPRSPGVETTRFAVLLQRKRLPAYGAPVPVVSSKVSSQASLQLQNRAQKSAGLCPPESGEILISKMPKEPLIFNGFSGEESAIANIPKAPGNSRPFLPNVISSEGTGGKTPLNLVENTASVVKTVAKDAAYSDGKPTIPDGSPLRESGITRSTSDVLISRGLLKSVDSGVAEKLGTQIGISETDRVPSEKMTGIRFISSPKGLKVAPEGGIQSGMGFEDAHKPRKHDFIRRGIFVRLGGRELSQFGRRMVNFTTPEEGSLLGKSEPSHNQMRQPLPELREITSQRFRTTPFPLSSEGLLESLKGDRTLADARNMGEMVSDQPKESMGEPKSGNATPVNDPNDPRELKSSQKITTPGKQVKGGAKNSEDSKSEVLVQDVLKPKKKGDWIEEGKPLSAKIQESSGKLQGNTAAVRNLTTNKPFSLEGEIERIATIKSLVDKIRGRAQLLKSGETAVFEARLNPPKLGVVQIQLEVQGDQMRLTFAAERPEAVAALQEARGELSSLVNQQGYTLAHCDIGSRFSQNRWTESGQGVYPNRRSFDENAMEDGDSSLLEDQKDQRRSLNLGYNTMDLVA